MADSAGIIRYVNPAFTKLTGYSSEEAVGRNPRFLKSGRQGLEFYKDLWATITGGRIWSGEIVNRRKNGSHYTEKMTVAPVRGAGGAIQGYIAIKQDVTERRAEEESLRFLASIVDHSPDAVVGHRPDGTITVWNRAAEELHGYRADEVIGKPVAMLVAPESAALVPEIIQGLRRGESFRGVETVAVRKGGEKVDVQLSLCPILDSAGQVTATAAIARDITGRKHAEQALARSEEMFRQLTGHISEVFWMTNAEGTEVLYVSPAYEAIWGRTCESLYSSPASWMEAIHPEDRAVAEKNFSRQLQGQQVGNEYRILKPCGAVRWILDRAFPIRDASGNVFRLAGVAEDITDRKLAEMNLRHQSRHDELTGLANRVLFRERLAEATSHLEPGKVGAVFFIDLDYFKLVNDTLGHWAGDLLLRETADRLRRACRDSDTLGRFGGDEFTLLATGFDSAERVREFADRLIRIVEGCFEIEGRKVFLGASVGISLFPAHGIGPPELMRKADIAMHAAKRSGRSQVKIYSLDFAPESLDRLEMQTHLCSALAEQQFRLQFQPTFALASTRPTRYEALIRWSPCGVPVSPAQFIPMAEEAGLIVPIGTWALGEACRQCAQWQTIGLGGTGVSVNVSALQFNHPDFVDTVARTLAATGLASGLLTLEITESAIMRDLDAAITSLTSLRGLGVRIALDDFGTGYSSLSYLQNLPLDSLKIDRGFLMRVSAEPRGIPVLKCIVDLAHALRLRVIAEGVETPAELELLTRLGCNEFQGYLLGQPSFVVTPPGAGSLEGNVQPWNGVVNGSLLAT